MSELKMCETLTVEILDFDKPIVADLDFAGEFVSSSDGEDYKRGYEEGHAQGLADGQAEGYTNGYNEGHSVGYNSGYTQGKEDGLTEGYTSGYDQGKSDGYKAGYDEGYSKGYSEGYEKGKSEIEGTEWVEDNSEVVYEKKCYAGGQGISLYITENGTGIYKDNGSRPENNSYFKPQWSYGSYNQISGTHGQDTQKVILVKQVEVIEDERVTELGRSLFACMKEIKVVKIPNNIVSIGATCFFDCKSLKKIELPESVTNIQSGAFQQCSKLESFKIPSLVTSLDTYVFSNCISLKNVEGIERLESIGGNCFDSCIELRGSITFNAKLQSLTSSAFRNCFNITEFVFLGIPEKIENTVFQNCVGVTNVSIPQGWDIDLYLQHFTNLTQASLHDMIEKFADMTGQTSPIMQVGSANLEKIDDEHKAMATAKNITLA